MASRNYRDLIAWQKGIDFVELVYRQTKNFPQDERFGLTAQLRRAAVSVPSNIAEGQARRSENEFRRFLSIALGSLAEVETQVLIAHRLSYIDSSQYDELLEASATVGRLINGLKNSLCNRES